jgi:hypothetical protein
MPCTDNVEIAIQNKNSKTIINSSQQSDEQHDHNTCTPFCQCACCGVSIVIQDFCFWKPKPNVYFYFTLAKTFYAKQNIEEVYINIWQPPKLVG